MRRRFSFLGIILLSVLLLGQSCTGGGGGGVAPVTEPVTLEYWRVFDDEDTMTDIIRAYRELHPNVTIRYRKFRFEEYEEALVNALAEDRGPDLFSIQNTWLDSYRSKLLPMPDVMNVTYLRERGGLRGGVEATVEQVAGYTPTSLRTNFVDTVSDDVVREEGGVGRVFALPLALDTLSLFYNRSLFNNAGIAQPPEDWEEFAEIVKDISVFDPDSEELLLSGAAFGAGRNIERAADLIAVLMQQNGAEMVDSRGRVVFDKTPTALQNRAVNPAADALRFYTDYAAPGQADVYTWSQEFPNSVDAFAQGLTAMMFGYSYHMEQLRTKSPRLAFDVAPLPQQQSAMKVTYANYWVEGVSQKTQYPDIAWDFIRFASSQEQVGSYLEKTHRPTALRSLIEPQKAQDPTVAPFVDQVLIAKNWYHGADPKGAEKAMLDLIDDALLEKSGTLAEERSRMLRLVRTAVQTVSAGY